MRVLKFGGTSVQDAVAIERLIQIIKGTPGPVWVVVSALARVTDQLLDLAHLSESGNFSATTPVLAEIRNRHFEIAQHFGLPSNVMEWVDRELKRISDQCQAISHLKECTPRARDSIVGTGELLSSFLISACAQTRGLQNRFVDARSVLVTDEQFGSAIVDLNHSAPKLKEMMTGRETRFFLGGFIGSTPGGMMTTLGRGGSDLSAALVASMIGATALEFFKDVDGILTTDPRVVKEAKLVRELSYDEAAELCFFGAKVLHPASIQPAVDAKIPVFILNSQKGREASGTEIKQSPSPSPDVLRALSLKRKVTLLNLHSTQMLGTSGFLRRVFDVFARLKISVDLIATSEVHVSLTLEKPLEALALGELCTELSGIAAVQVDTHAAVISCVGEGLRTTPGVASRIFEALKNVNILMISQGASELNLSVVVKDSDVEIAVRQLHYKIFGAETA